jgi:L-fuculokinase
MIEEAVAVGVGTHGLTIDPSFYNDSGNADGGIIRGLTINTKREEIYRALLESLGFRLREGIEALQEAGGFKINKIICVGGGSKNDLWNQLRADICNVPLELIEQKETTVLGAALFVFAGTGIFKSVDEARKNIEYKPQKVHPSDNADSYIEAYRQYLVYKTGN